MPEDKTLMDYLAAGKSLVLGKGSLEELCMARQFYRKARNIPDHKKPPVLSGQLPEDE